jgi:hypothetical protein
MIELFVIGSALFSIGVLWEFHLMRRRVERLERHVANIYAALVESVSNRID